MLAAMDESPVNVLLLGKGNTVSRRGAARAGARPAPAASSCTRTGARRRPRSTRACAVADETGVQVAIHTDTLNETGFLESTVEAIAGRGDPRVPHRGRGRRPRAGHHPDRVVPERAAVVDEPDAPAHGQHRRRAPRHAHGLPPPEPARARGSGVRGEPHPRDDDRGRGRAARPRRDLDDRLRLAGDGTGRRDDHPHLADGARDEGAARPAGERAAPTTRGRGATSPSTRSAPRSRTGSTPSSARSRSGSSPTSCSGSRASSASGPHAVLKGGAIAWAPIGDANASIPTPQPVLGRPMFAGSGRAAAEASLAFVAPAALEAGCAERLGLRRRRSRRSRTRAGVGKADLPREHRAARTSASSRTPSGSGSTARRSSRGPAAELPLAQRYFLF